MPQNLPLRFARFVCRGGAGALRGCARLFRPHPALACHLPHPGEGSSRRFVTVRYSADFSVRLRSSADFSVKSRSRTEKIGTAERSLPPGGEGGAPVPDEGETGERTHVMHPTNTQRQESIPRPDSSPCHPERSGTNIKNHALPPIIAAQRTPPQAGRQQAGSPLLRGTTQRHAPPKKAFPRVGKVSRQRRMRAKQASVAHNAPHYLVSASRDGGMRYTLRSNNGDPACWRPVWGTGFDCAAMFCCIVRPYTRCAASLRMTRWVTGARDKKQNAVSVSLTELSFVPSKFRTTFRLTPVSS